MAATTPVTPPTPLALPTPEPFSNEFNFWQVPILSHIATPSVVIVAYLILVYGGITQRLVFKYKPVERMGESTFNTIGVVYNMTLSLGSAALLAATLLELCYMFARTSLFDVFCDPNGRFVGSRIYYWYFINHLFKYVELFDTLLIQLNKKRPEWLQVYHHTVTLALTWVQLYSEVSVQFVPIVINLTIHVWMYYYYALTYYNKKHNITEDVWWKTYLTASQILQFIVAMVLGAVVLTMRALLRFGLAPAGMPKCYGTDWGAVFGFAVLFTFLVAFIDVYKTNERKKAARKLARAAAAMTNKKQSSSNNDDGDGDSIRKSRASPQGSSDDGGDKEGRRSPNSQATDGRISPETGCGCAVADDIIGAAMTTAGAIALRKSQDEDPDKFKDKSA